MLEGTAATEAPVSEQTTAVATEAQDTKVVELPTDFKERLQAFKEGKFDSTPAATETVVEEEVVEEEVVEGEVVEGEVVEEGVVVEGEVETTDETDEGEEVVEGEEAVEGEPYVLKLPPRREGEEELEVELDGLDAKQIEAFNRLKNGYIRRQEAEALIAEQREMLTDLAEDPIGFLSEKVSESLRKETALAILGSFIGTKTYDEIVDTLNDWEVEPANMTSALLDRQVRNVHRAVQKLIPEGTPSAEAVAFEQDAMQYIHSHVVTRRLPSLDPKDVPALVARIAKGYGFNAPTPAGSSQPEKTKTAASSPSPVPGPTKEQKAVAEATGKKLVTASKRRREAAATAPSGVAGVAGSNAPPKGQTFKERLEWFKKQ